VVRIDAIRFGHGVPARVAELRPLAAGVRIVLEIGSVRIEAAAPLAGAPRPGATVPVSVDERYVSLLPLEAAVPG
jgi:hypothetical protein